MTINSIKNLNTNEDILKSAKNPSIEIVEVSKQNIVFELPLIPQKFYAKLLISGVINVKGKSIAFEFIGKIVSNENFEDVTRISVDLLQFDKQLWVQFLQGKKEKQEHADRLFHSIKGEE